MNNKIYFIDLDGTLVDEKTKNGFIISTENLNALKEQQKKGVYTIISTGRSGYQAKKFLDQIDYEYAVTGNGAIILKKDKIIQQINMSLKQVVLLIEFAKKNKLSIKANNIREIYGCNSFLQKTISKKLHYKPTKTFYLDLSIEYYKFIFWGKRKKKMFKLIKIIEKEVPGVRVVSSGRGWILEITHEDATKGKANLFVANLLGIKNKNNMCHIGDSMNDSTVVEFMPLIAMRNSSKCLIKKATFIGPHYKNGGVSKIFKGEYKKIMK